MWEGDKPGDAKSDSKEAGPKRIHCMVEPERFHEELGKIGQRFVGMMADTPACHAAYEAWCEVFVEQWGELKGTDGEDFVLEKELTWELFKEVLHSMPGGKAVGAGGLHAELLWTAGESAQRVFYDALMADLRRGAMPDEWHKVLYALLVKPKPSNPEVVAERREIALMAHDMKLFLQMVRRISYQRVVGRVVAEQSGWLAGFGATDPALTLAILTKQAARLHKPIYLLYIDLATFFPRCDRRVITIAEALHGLPRQVRELSLQIFGTADQPEKAVECFYDSAGGLGAGFRNHMGGTDWVRAVA